MFLSMLLSPLIVIFFKFKKLSIADLIFTAFYLLYCTLITHHFNIPIGSRVSGLFGIIPVVSYIIFILPEIQNSYPHKFIRAVAISGLLAAYLCAFLLL